MIQFTPVVAKWTQLEKAAWYRMLHLIEASPAMNGIFNNHFTHPKHSDTNTFNHSPLKCRKEKHEASFKTSSSPNELEDPIDPIPRMIPFYDTTSFILYVIIYILYILYIYTILKVFSSNHIPKRWSRAVLASKQRRTLRAPSSARRAACTEAVLPPASAAWTKSSAASAAPSHGVPWTELSEFHRSLIAGQCLAMITLYTTLHRHNCTNQIKPFLSCKHRHTVQTGPPNIPGRQPCFACQRSSPSAHNPSCFRSASEPAATCPRTWRHLCLTDLMHQTRHNITS